MFVPVGYIGWHAIALHVRSAKTGFIEKYILVFM